MPVWFRRVVPIIALIAGVAGTGEPGDRHWTPTGLTEVRDLDVCGTVTYAATLSGLYRSNGEPDQWELVWSGEVSRVACDGATVLFVAGRPYEGPVYVSHDAMETVNLTTGLDSFVSEGIEDLDVTGSQALAGVGHGVIRSTDGGSSFSIYTVLWDSSGDYEIKAVWTDGTACAAGSERGWDSGLWYSATCERYTFTLVDASGGQGWLNGSGDTVVAGPFFADEYGGSEGYISEDGGASWEQLPWNWGDGLATDFYRPFVSGPIIMSSNSYSVFDFDLDDFVGHVDGLYLFDRDLGLSADMATGFPATQPIFLTAIVETADPFLLVAESPDVWEPLETAEMWWYRIPGGWPASGFDFTPPDAGEVVVSPTLISSPGHASASASMSATGATQMYLSLEQWQISASIGPGTLTATSSGKQLGSPLGWQTYAPATQVSLGTGSGFYFVDAWFADNAGNMTDPSVWDAVTVVPSVVHMEEGQCWAGWVVASAGETLTLGAAQTGGSGDIDVLHAEPNSLYWSNWSMYIGVNDSLTFTAQNTGYHQVYICNYPEGLGAYEGGLVASKASEKVGTGCKTAGSRSQPPKPAVSVSHETMPFHELVSAVEIFDDGFESGDRSAWSNY